MRFLFFIFIFALAAEAWALGPVGDIVPWAGKYIITKCIHCPDQSTGVGTNFKNIKWFYIGRTTIAPVNQPRCAQTDVGLTFAYYTLGDDGTQNVTSRDASLCGWDTSQSLTADADSFDYERKADAYGLQMSVQLKRIDSHTFHIYTHEVWSKSKFGFPLDWYYEMEGRLSNELGDEVPGSF